MDPDIQASQARQGWVRRCRGLLLVSWLVCLVTTLLVPCTDAEVTLFAGPVLFALGLIMVAVGLYRRVSSVAWAGIGHCTICAVCFGSVAIGHLGRRETMVSFLLLGLAYCVLAGVHMVEAYKHLPLYGPCECQRCGYPLIGLSERRCPECGKPFRPAQLAALRALQVDPPERRPDGSPPIHDPE